MTRSTLTKLTVKIFDERLNALIKAKKLKANNECLPAVRRVLIQGDPVAVTAEKYGVDMSYLSRMCWLIQKTDVCKCCGQVIK